MSRIVIFIVLCTLAPHTSALNLGFLKNSVLSRFSSEEMKDFKETVVTALANEDDGQIIEWRARSGELFARVLIKGSYLSNGDTECSISPTKIRNRAKY